MTGETHHERAARRRAKREAATAISDALFAASFDARELDRIESETRQQTLSRYQRTEQQRVRALLEQDRADKAAEQFRVEAAQRFESGDSASSVDMVIPPTREWLEKGEFTSMTSPHQDRHSVKVIKTVRRPNVPQARKMMLDGRIDMSGLGACEWYAELYEKTGLSGNIPSVDYGREVFSAPNSRAVFTDWQLEAQDTFKAVRQFINGRFLPLLDAMVLEDLPYYRAERLVRSRKGKAKAFFVLAVEQLCAARKAVEA